MPRMRLLIIFAILIVLIAVVVAVLLPQLNRPAGTVSTTGQTVVQQQQQSTPCRRRHPGNCRDRDRRAGPAARFPHSAQRSHARTVPQDLAPYNAITSLDDVVGKIARTDIYREQPILSNLVVEDLTDIARVGSDAAAILPE